MECLLYCLINSRCLFCRKHPCFDYIFLSNTRIISYYRVMNALQNYNALSFDDEILDGFYDLYGIMTESNSSKMPSLVDLQRTPVSDQIAWEAILVNRAADSKLLMLEQKALEISVKVRSESIGFTGGNLVQTLAMLVSEHMGGRVGDPESMLVAWRSLSYNLKATFGSMVLPLGSLTIGLARHRALLFKVLSSFDLQNI